MTFARPRRGDSDRDSIDATWLVTRPHVYPFVRSRPKSRDKNIFYDAFRFHVRPFRNFLAVFFFFSKTGRDTIFGSFARPIRVNFPNPASLRFSTVIEICRFLRTKHSSEVTNVSKKKKKYYRFSIRRKSVLIFTYTVVDFLFFWWRIKNIRFIPSRLRRRVSLCHCKKKSYHNKSNFKL